MRRGPRTFRSDNKEDRHTCYTINRLSQIRLINEMLFVYVL